DDGVVAAASGQNVVTVAAFQSDVSVASHGDGVVAVAANDDFVSACNSGQRGVNAYIAVDDEHGSVRDWSQVNFYLRGSDSSQSERSGSRCFGGDGNYVWSHAILTINYAG